MLIHTDWQQEDDEEGKIFQCSKTVLFFFFFWFPLLLCCWYTNLNLEKTKHTDTDRTLLRANISKWNAFLLSRLSPEPSEWGTEFKSHCLWSICGLSKFSCSDRCWIFSGLNLLLQQDSTDGHMQTQIWILKQWLCNSMFSGVPV
jgi:hypothetical protein